MKWDGRYGMVVPLCLFNYPLTYLIHKLCLLKWLPPTSLTLLEAQRLNGPQCLTGELRQSLSYTRPQLTLFQSFAIEAVLRSGNVH